MQHIALNTLNRSDEALSGDHAHVQGTPWAGTCCARGATSFRVAPQECGMRHADSRRWDQM
jgi:hypothetical protein